ncbi:MAG: DUF4838 domain-containing protein, partial [Planctomycetes bacterium]|nr:DUF4838 domain-containing protein [Planctomycetota bacterium]
PCLSSKGLFEQNVKYVRAVFDIFDAPLESVMPADGYVSLCQCDLCKGKDTPELGWNGQISDYVWDYVNRVAQEVHKTHPNKKILCFAYGAYMLPPTKIAKLNPNILVGICQGRSAFSGPEKRQGIAGIRKGWLDKLPEANKQLMTYDYYLHARPERPFAFIPTFFPHAIAWDLKSLKGVSLGDFIEVYREKDGLATLAANHLNLYVTSRLWWDADQDVDALLEEYYTLFYGPARDEMKAFIAYCEANWQDLPKSAEKIGRTFELLAKAQENAAADSAHGQRIALIAGYIKPLKDLREQLVKGRQGVPRFKLRDLQDAKIKMDGILDDEAWQGLPAVGLRELETGRPPVHKTTFRAFWANNALHLGIRCDDPDAKNLVIGATKPDDTNVWNGDCVEALIETQTHSYYQLAISPSGALMDLDRKQGLNTKWSSRAEVTSHIGQDFWSLEVRIPVAGDLQGDVDPLNGVAGRRPTSTYPWYFNVCRQRVRQKDMELSAFSPTGKRVFHDLMKFAELWMQ